MWCLVFVQFERHTGEMGIIIQVLSTILEFTCPQIRNCRKTRENSAQTIITIVWALDFFNFFFLFTKISWILFVGFNNDTLHRLTFYIPDFLLIYGNEWLLLLFSTYIYMEHQWNFNIEIKVDSRIPPAHKTSSSRSPSLWTLPIVTVTIGTTFTNTNHYYETRFWHR